jgi:tungstate transport system substrate-binding protein
VISRRIFCQLAVFAFVWGAHFVSPVQAQTTPRHITLSSTTSTSDSGLLGHLLPIFTAKTSIAVRVVSQGTGQALETGRRGDADVLLTHARGLELKFVADGFGTTRKPVMYNDYVLVGPKSDPAAIRGESDITAVMRRILEKRAAFVSRGDLSGTHQTELGLWQAAGVQISEARGAWYREIGQGMGAALNTAGAMGAYVLADRATWISFKNKGDLDVLVQGDPRMFNQYGVIPVSPLRHPHVKAADAQVFMEWLVSPDGQKAIAAFKVNGAQLFVPNADQPEPSLN